MKPRHAAALALVGWYLMVPCEDGSKKPHFGHWEVVLTFAEKKACEQAASALRADALGQSAIYIDPNQGDARALKIWQNESALCVEFQQPAN